MPYSDPNKQAEYQRQYRKRKREAAAQAGEAELQAQDVSEDDPLEFETIADIKRALAREYRAVAAASSDPHSRARVVALLANTALAAIEKGELTERLEAIERQLEQGGVQ